MEEKEKKAQELYLEYKTLEDHIKRMQSQLEALTGQIVEANSTSSSLEDFGKIKKESEIFVPISSGIFAKAAIKSTSEVVINVGANTVVTKDLESAKKMVNRQLEEMKRVHKKIIDNLEKMASRAAQLEAELQKLVSEG